MLEGEPYNSRSSIGRKRMIINEILREYLKTAEESKIFLAE
jgi:hypothetical protein